MEFDWQKWWYLGRRAEKSWQELVLACELWKVLREIVLFEFLSSTPQSNQNISRTSFHSRCVSYENCKHPRRNYTPKHENCFAIFVSVCNFHISLQFSYQFAILMFKYSSYVVVYNFHMALQLSCEFAIIISVCNCNSHIMSQLQHFVCVALHGFNVTMTLNSLTPRQPRFSMEDEDN